MFSSGFISWDTCTPRKFVLIIEFFFLIQSSQNLWMPDQTKIWKDSGLDCTDFCWQEDIGTGATGIIQNENLCTSTFSGWRLECHFHENYLCCRLLLLCILDISISAVYVLCINVVKISTICSSSPPWPLKFDIFLNENSQEKSNFNNTEWLWVYISAFHPGQTKARGMHQKNPRHRVGGGQSTKAYQNFLTSKKCGGTRYFRHFWAILGHFYNW